ncbi:unnamed protein product [Mycena citricolor]|uniref:Uncharacterized protein n=1 Tax=Mycena citricolor TaxID=2018698 RepID=A0AAD2HFC1_9AGAR|nr:unnamed protein product [Mycena citricolor]
MRIHLTAQYPTLAPMKTYESDPFNADPATQSFIPSAKAEHGFYHRLHLPPMHLNIHIPNLVALRTRQRKRRHPLTTESVQILSSATQLDAGTSEEEEDKKTIGATSLKDGGMNRWYRPQTRSSA